jgi:hypothetical protein
MLPGLLLGLLTWLLEPPRLLLDVLLLNSWNSWMVGSALQAAEGCVPLAVSVLARTPTSGCISMGPLGTGATCGAALSDTGCVLPLAAALPAAATSSSAVAWLLQRSITTLL